MVDPTISDLPKQRFLSKTAEAANPNAMMATIQLLQTYQLFSEAVVRDSQPCVLMPQSVKDFSAPTSGPSTEILRTFERTFNTDPQNVGNQCPSLDVLDGDVHLINDLLMKWTLDSALCFFDLLGFDIYDHWKKLGASKEDLQRYCTYCKKLSLELLSTKINPMNVRVFNTIRLVFKSFEQKIPAELKPKFEFLLKALSYPEQAVVLGCKSVGYFGINEVLDGNSSRREDVIAFLDFAKQMYPTELYFIDSTCDDVTLSRKLYDLMDNIVKELKKVGKESEKNVALTELHNFVTNLKIISDKRLNKKELNIGRLFINLQFMDFNSKYRSWILEKFQEYLGIDLLAEGQRYIQSSIDLYGALVPRDTTYIIMNLLANNCTIRGCNLDILEAEIAERLNCERHSNSSEEYAQIFSEMIRLYQLIYDIYTIKDIVHYRLNGNNIPASFFEESDGRTKELLADKETKPEVDRSMPVLPQTSSIDPKQSPVRDVPVFPPLAQELPVCEIKPTVVSQLTPKSTAVPQLTPKSVVPMTAPAQAPKKKSSSGRTIKEMSPREEKKPREEKHAQPCSNVEKPYFPSNNVSGEEMLHYLLDNGFALERTKGSHRQMKHVLTNVPTTVPIHGTISPGTLASIRRAFYQSQGIER